MWGALQRGETVVLDDGREVTPDQVLGTPRRGRVVAYATDTRPCSGLEQVCRGADIAFLEGMFTNEHEADARSKSHMTAAQAAAVAAKAGVERLVLLHISPRYSLADEAILRREAREHLPEAVVGRSLDSFDVPLP